MRKPLHQLQGWRQCSTTKMESLSMDVKSTLLNGVPKEEVYVEKRPGYEIEGQEHKVCKMRRALWVEARTTSMVQQD